MFITRLVVLFVLMSLTVYEIFELKYLKLRFYRHFSILYYLTYYKPGIVTNICI